MDEEKVSTRTFLRWELTYLELNHQPLNPRKLGGEALPSSTARPNTWLVNRYECKLKNVEHTFQWVPLCSLGWFDPGHEQMGLCGRHTWRRQFNTHSVIHPIPIPIHLLHHIVTSFCRCFLYSYQMALLWMSTSQTLYHLPSWNQNMWGCSTAQNRSGRYIWIHRRRTHSRPALIFNSKSVPIFNCPLAVCWINRLQHWQQKTRFISGDTIEREETAKTSHM